MYPYPTRFPAPRCPLPRVRSRTGVGLGGARVATWPHRNARARGPGLVRGGQVHGPMDAWH